MTLSVRSEKVKTTTTSYVKKQPNLSRNFFFCIKSQPWSTKIVEWIFFSMISCFVALIEFNRGNRVLTSLGWTHPEWFFSSPRNWKTIWKIIQFLTAWNSRLEMRVFKWMVKRWRLPVNSTYKYIFYAYFLVIKIKCLSSSIPKFSENFGLKRETKMSRFEKNVVLTFSSL